jgi:hypothetical protein
VLEDDVVNPRTMFPPCAHVVAVQVRSLEMPALNTYNEPLLTEPDWARAPVPAFTSYQLIWLPAPPATVWLTQIPVAPMFGSKPTPRA